MYKLNTIKKNIPYEEKDWKSQDKFQGFEWSSLGSL